MGTLVIEEAMYSISEMESVLERSDYEYQWTQYPTGLMTQASDMETEGKSDFLSDCAGLRAQVA